MNDHQPARPSSLALLGGTPVRARDFPVPPVLTPEEQTEVASVLTLPAWSALPPAAPPDAVTLLEHAWAAGHGGGEAVAISSGTTSLSLALRALGLAPGDEVIVPAYGCIAPEMAVLEAGGVPIHADIDPGTYCLAVEDVKRRLSARTRAIVAVHFGGQAADMGALGDLSRSAGVGLIEDASLSAGGVGRDRPLRSWGAAAVFSLGIDKPIHAGEGGILLTRDARLAERCRVLRSLGQALSDNEEPEYDLPGGNHRMTALQAAAALPQLSRLQRDRAHREQNARRLLAALRPNSPFRPLALPAGTHAWSQLWLRLAPGSGVSPARAAAAFQAEGIPVFPGWDRPNYAHRLFTPERAAVWLRARGSLLSPDAYLRTHCPAAEAAAFNEALVIPLTLLRATPADIEDVVEAFEKIQEHWDELL